MLFSESFAGIYSVLDFGAVGDGVTDNTAAFTAALNEAGKKAGAQIGFNISTEKREAPQRRIAD